MSMKASADSFLGWIDASNVAQRRILEQLSLLEESDTVDELGLGTVRDAVADRLFPGTSTIQTRARYLLFVPWICASLEREPTPPAEARRRLRTLEGRLIEALRKGVPKTESLNGSGLIGKLKGKEVQRLPSSIYWSGLFTYGIRINPQSLDSYLRSLRFMSDQSAHQPRPDGEATTQLSTNWHSALPAAPEGMLDEVSFRLTPAEKRYLRERILFSSASGSSLLAFFARQASAPSDTPFVWTAGECERLLAPLATDVMHGRNFSESIHGAQLLYNLMLAELSQAAGLVERYRDKLDGWAQQMHARMPAFETWNHDEFWAMVEQHGRVAWPTRVFIESWWRAVARAGPIADDRDARTLVRDRERALKGSQARVNGGSALRDWQLAGAAGATQLDFRWRNARRLLRDVTAQGRGN